MHRFWPSLIKPVFEIVKPASIMEIGPGDECNTANLAEYCLQTEGKLHVVDPLPLFDVIQWKSRYENVMVLHQESSLDALSKIASCDAAIIDGDHNWYTVFNELILIEKISQHKQFPVVFVHHTGWPYGRRDSYRDPQSIPILYRKPNRKAGLSPDQNKLVDEGGLNSNLYNSVYENTPQNGVLTAVEDFLRSTTHDIRLISIPSLNGLALLLPRSLLKERPALAAFADSFEMNAVVLDHLKAVEKDRIAGLLARERLEETGRRKDIALQYKAKLLRKAERDIGKLEARIDLMESSFGWKVLCRLKKNRMLLFLYFLFKENNALRRLFSLPARMWGRMRRQPHILPAQDRPGSEGSIEYTRLKQVRPSSRTISLDDETEDSLYQAIEFSFHEAQERSKRKCADRTCNIIIPIHNELDSVKRCLESIEKYTDYPYRVYLIDDCSDNHTKTYLRDFVRDRDQFQLIENEENLGFGGSCNTGMAATPSGDILLLNSDVIVAPGWLRKIATCAYSDPAIGVVTPLSNRSPHCWMQMNPGDNIFTAAAKIEKLSKKKYPDVVTTEGWCLFIKRTVYEHIGPFDPVFGKGYCEDSDFSMRALCNGYRTVCADDTFIFHKGSASFKKERADCYTHNRRIFDRRWGPYYEKLYEEFLSQDPLQYIRSKYQATADRHYLTIAEAFNRPQKELFSILKDEKLKEFFQRQIKNVSGMHKRDEIESGGIIFLLPALVKNGGVLSVTQLVNDLILSGVDAKIAVLEPAPNYENIVLYTTPIAFAHFDDLIQHFPRATYIVATHWITMYYLLKIVKKHRHLIPCYFIQDFEPYFYEEHEAEMRRLVLDSYRFPAKRFAKTHWIINKVAELGYPVQKVPPGLDLEIFYPRDTCAGDDKNEKFKIVVMMRPSSRHRGFEFMCEVLDRVKREFTHVEIHGFGATEEELEEYSIPFDFVNHEILSPWQLADLYSSADLYIDFSDFHGFGRTAVEAMACGTCVAMTNSGGVDEYAVNEYNCLLSTPGDLPEMLSNIRRLIRDSNLRNCLAANGLESVKRFERTFSSKETWKYIDEGPLSPQDSKPVQKQAGAPFVPRAAKHTVVLVRAGDYKGRLPQALLSLAAGLDQEVVLLDNATSGMILEHEDAVKNAICVGFSTITGPQIKCSLETAKAVRTLNRQAPLVWGGWHPSLLPEQTLENGLVDKVVVGRGDKVLHDIIMNIKEGRAFDDILAGEEKDGCQVPLDLLIRRGDMEKYIVPGLTSRTIFLYTSASRPPWPGTGGADSACMKKARQPAHNIVEFIQYMIKKFGIDGVHFDDEDFFSETRAALDFCESLLKADVNVCWSAGADVESLCSLAPSEWEMLERSGCKRLFLRAESGSRVTLQKLKRKITPELIREAASLCGRYGIIPGFAMILGFPEETYPEMEETFHLAGVIKKDVPTSEPLVFLYAPYPGAPLYDLAREMGFQEPDSFEAWGSHRFDISATPWLDEALAEHVREFNSALPLFGMTKST